MEASSKMYFHKSGNEYRVTPKVKLDLHDKLPVGTYNINFDDHRNEFYLETINNFEIKGKIYGDIAKSSSRIMNTFLDRQSKSTGVLLVGEKGSGKTLLAQHISIAAAKAHQIPTIVVNKPWHGDEFNAFISSISQPVIIFMDEFEKVYEAEANHQEKILTLFDGVYSSQKLFLLTCNEKHRIDSHMINRPGRLYYVLDFTGLEQQFIKEYCQDNLLNKDYIPAVAASAALFQSFNFDMLKALVEDMNRYNESPSEVLKYLNVRPDGGDDEKFAVKLIVNGKNKNKAMKAWSGNPMSEVIRINIYDYDRTEEDGEEEETEHYFSAKNLQKLDPKTRVFRFKNEKGNVLILTPAPRLNFTMNYDTLATTAAKDDSSVDATYDTVSYTEEDNYKALVEY